MEGNVDIGISGSDMLEESMTLVRTLEFSQTFHTARRPAQD